MSKKFKLLHGFVLSTLVFSGIVFGYILFSLVYPYKLFQLNTKYLDIENENQVVAGQLVKVNIDYCKFSDLPCESSYAIYNGYTYGYQSEVRNAPRGCRKVTREILIPLSIPVGTYKIALTLKYHLNAFRDVYYRFESEEFTVINKK
jgi:hypothetical protein